ncbi:MAG: flavodoxin [Christensenellaceae bacterium]|jgi:flavodoxin short chain|nr:flavodoxin [Christensenellaceae bacterium]
MCKDIVIVYWTGTGNTEQLAESIASGIKDAGGCVDVFNVADTNADAVAAYNKIVLGCPAMGDEVLEEGEFEPFYLELESKLAGKTVALFGSYDWGDGEWMRRWSASAEAAGANVVETLIVQLSEDGSAQAGELGKKLV